MEQAIQDWNTANSRHQGVVLQPWVWVSSAGQGDHTQQVITPQGVDESDIVFALLGGGLGYPTLAAVSGTVQEIDRALALGKHIHIYISRALLPHNAGAAHIEASRAFKRHVQDRGLLNEFNTPEQLNRQVMRAIEMDIAAFHANSATEAQPEPGVDFIVQPGQEREVCGVYATGAPRYRTYDWLDVTNTSDRDAESVTFETVIDGAHMRLRTPKDPTTIHRGQTRRLPVVYPAGDSEGARIRIRWIEDGQSMERDFQVS